MVSFLSANPRGRAIISILLLAQVPEGTYRTESSSLHLNFTPRDRIIALMLGRLRMDVDTAITHYDALVNEVFSDMKWGENGKFKATKLETAIKSIVKSVTGDPETRLLEGGQAGQCRTCVLFTMV